MNVDQFSRQVRMARGVLGWTAAKLAEQAKISQESVTKAENADPTLLRANWMALQQALEHAFIEFFEDGTIKQHDNGDHVAIVASPDMPAGGRLLWPM